MASKTPKTPTAKRSRKTKVSLPVVDAAQVQIERAAQELSAAQANLLAAQRLMKARQAQDSLIAFTEYTMPDIVDPDDADKTRYSAQYFHKALAAALEEVEAGRLLRLIITFPPRHGKSELTSRRFPAWAWGRDPYRHIILGTYNQPFAEDYGRDVRGIMQSPQYATVFPECQLAKGSQAADRLKTVQGGMSVFVGRGGSATGRGGDILIIDDPLKDRAEANSETIRNELWDWFNDTISTRLMSDTGAIIIIQTRWHEDDLVGRLTDPQNPNYSASEAKQWKIINIPAIAEEDDVLGREPGEALWPEKFGIDYLENFRSRNPVGFSALYQQRPTPKEGDFFKEDMILTYRPEDAPDVTKLRIYAASDHAVATKQRNDFTCLLIVGVDDASHIWLLDCWWKKARTDEVAEAMIMLMRKWKPMIWWAEKGHITQSMGPFLFKRMREEQVFVNVREQTPAQDKATRAQSILGRAAMGMVHFPLRAQWYSRALSETLTFPQGRHDDFVDTLAHIGLGLDTMINAPSSAVTKRKVAKVGTFGWVKENSKREQQKRRRSIVLGGM